MAAGDLSLSGVVTFSVPSVDEIVAGVWDELLAAHVVPGSTGRALGAVGAVADPLEQPVPGSYPPGSGGAALGRLLTQPVTVTGPVNRSMDMTLVHGDSYLETDGNAIILTGGWPDLTGWTLEWTARPYAQGEAARSVAAARRSDNAVEVELPAAETTLLVPGGRYLWDVQASRGQSVMTVVRGRLDVLSDASP